MKHTYLIVNFQLVARSVSDNRPPQSHEAQGLRATVVGVVEQLTVTGLLI